ncbi:MAG: DUF1772 domain-containing protein [Chitinophagaceae bacterium]|nr:DUF1772 domain-containing protein [Chitinophagaceae bacterium]
MKSTVLFLAILFALVTLSALLAHLLEMPEKLKMNNESYQIVQSIYRGWAWLGIFELGAIVLTGTWAVFRWKSRQHFPHIIIAFACFVLSILIFFLYTYPTNAATNNWTTLPDNWEQLKYKWEFSHAGRAISNLTGLSLLVIVLVKEASPSQA